MPNGGALQRQRRKSRLPLGCGEVRRPGIDPPVAEVAAAVAHARDRSAGGGAPGTARRAASVGEALHEGRRPTRVR